MRFFTTFILAVSTLFLGYGQVKVDKETKIISLQENCQVFSTPEDSIDILKVPDELWLQPNNGLNFGLVREIKWIRCSVENTSNQSIELNFYVPYHHIRSLKIFKEEASSLKKIASLGTSESYSLKEKKTFGHCAKVEIPKGKHTFFFRTKHLNTPLRANIFLVSDEELNNIVYSNNVSRSIWLTVMLMGFILSLIFYLITKIRMFLIYLFLNTGVILFIGMEVGLLFWVFDKDNWSVLTDIKHLGDVIVLIAFPYFLNELANIRKHSPVIWRVIMVLWWVALGSWVTFLVPGIKGTAYYYYSILFSIYFTVFVFMSQLLMLFKAYFKREKNSLTLLGIYSLYILIVVFEVILPNLGGSSSSVYPYNLLLKSSMGEIIVFLCLMGVEMYAVFKTRNDLLEKQKNHKRLLLNAIVSSQENERNIIGKELHDMVGGNMSVLRQGINKDQTGLVKLIDETIDSVRNLSHGLMTPKMNNGQLKNAIIDLCVLATTDDFQVNYYFHNWRSILDDEEATHFYRIVQELLQNAIKHSQASEVFLQTVIKGNTITLSFEDNGKGFDVKKKGKGLLGIMNRVEVLNAEFNIESSSSGTIVEVIIRK